MSRLYAFLTAARKSARAAGVQRLLADPTANPKIAKGGKIGVLTAPLHLAPGALSGFQTCPMASRGCLAACLNTAGNPAYAKGKRNARNKKTQLYFNDRATFMVLLVAEIAAHERKAAEAHMSAAVRLNATSDIPWERVPCERDGASFPNVMAAFPDVSFYDYTKRYNRKSLPANYTLTFSLSEDNAAYAALAYASGMNVAVVFATKRGRALPSQFSIGDARVPVIDGDVHDYRPADGHGVVVGLRAKGKAIGDTSGFVKCGAF
jgi:hypothetical protein